MMKMAYDSQIVKAKENLKLSQGGTNPPIKVLSWSGKFWCILPSLHLISRLNETM